MPPSVARRIRAELDPPGERAVKYNQRLPRPLIDALREEALMDGRPTSNLVKELLIAGIALRRHIREIEKT